MNFQIPSDVNIDILYCQKSLRHYIHVHQMLAATLSAKNMGLQKHPHLHHINSINKNKTKKGNENSSQKKKTISIYIKLDDPRLVELENEILGIGRDQKVIVDKLRLHMENYFVFLERQNLSIDRLTANANVAKQLFQNLPMCYDKVEPINVKKRLSDNELIDRYIYNRGTISESAAAKCITKYSNTYDCATMYGHAAAGAIKIIECSDPETLEVLISSNREVFENNLIVPQKSLLKPKSDRLAPNSPKNDYDEQLHSSSSSANLKSHRLNLRQVLQTKSENQTQTQNLDQDDKNVKTINNSIPPAPVTNKTIENDDVVSIETDITSGTSLSVDSFNKRDLLDDDKVRKRRSRISTEKRDFHCGNIDIFERQSVRSNNRVFLKSTHRYTETKAKRAQSDAGASSANPKSETKSISSSKHDDMKFKLCAFCLKNANSENILECESCSVYYHLGCHKSDEAIYIHSQRSKSRYCPDCLRKQQNGRET